MKKSLSESNIMMVKKYKSTVLKHTDRLHNALKDALQQCPEHLISQNVVNSSILKDEYQKLTQSAITQIKSSIIISQKDLIPTLNHEKVQAIKFKVIDAHVKVLGGPIDQYQLQNILKFQPKSSKIVYQYQTNQNTNHLLKSTNSSPNLLKKTIQLKPKSIQIGTQTPIFKDSPIKKVSFSMTEKQLQTQNLSSRSNVGCCMGFSFQK